MFTCQMCKEFLPRKHQHAWLSSRFSSYPSCRMTEKGSRCWSCKSVVVDASMIPHCIRFMKSSLCFGLLDHAYIFGSDYVFDIQGSRMHSLSLSRLTIFQLSQHFHIFLFSLQLCFIVMYFASNIKSRTKMLIYKLYLIIVITFNYIT